MATKADAAGVTSRSSSSPGVLSKLRLKRGQHPYQEVSRTATPEHPKSVQTSTGSPPAPTGASLLDVILDEDLLSERGKWLEWLENDEVPSDVRKREVCRRDEKGLGWSALHHAARHKRTDILGCAADVDGVDMNMTTYGEQLTPLLVAAKYSVKDSIVWMMTNKDTAGIETSAVTVEGQNALHLVVQNHQCEYSLEALLRQLDQTMWLDPDHHGNTPLHVACAHGNLDALQQGFFKRDIWLVKGDGGQLGSDGGSEAPSDVRSDVEGSDAEGSGTGDQEEPRDEEEEEEEEEDEEKHPRTSLWISEKLKEMIRKTNNDEQTSLHLAAVKGHEKVVGLLIERCRDVIKYKDCNGDMALHLACRRGHLEVVKEILDLEPTTVGMKYTNNKGETPVHCAAYNASDNSSLMKHLMDVCNKNSTLDLQDILSLHEEEARHTPLMLACTKGKPEVVKVLLDHGADVTEREKVKQAEQEEQEEQETLNSLELAIENGRKEVAKVIIDRDDWKKSLRTSNVIGREANTPFRRMIRKMPDIALVVLDKCTEENFDRDDVHFTMKFDYEFVEDFYVKRPDQPTSSEPTTTSTANVVFRGNGKGSLDSIPGEVKEKGEGEGEVELKEVKVVARDHDSDDGVVVKRSLVGEDDTDNANTSAPPNEDWKPREYNKENHVLSIMVENNRSELLQHPLVTSLLTHKWNQFGAWMFFINLLFYLVYIIFLTAFALTVPNPQNEMCVSRTSRNCDISTTRHNFLFFAAVVTIVFAVSRLIFEVFQLIHWTQSRNPNPCGFKYKLYINWSYWLDWTNYIEIVLYSFSIGFVIVFDDCYCPTSAQWQIGTVAVFFAWIDLLMFLYKLPKIGIYVGMMLQITQRFLNVVIIAILLSLAFGFAFYMAFFEPSIPASPFANPLLSFVKLMVMTSGGPDDSIFRYENEGSGRRSELPFPEVAFFIWIIFIVIMAILFVNFLVGLAVDDVKQIQQSATLRRLSLKVDLVLSSEQVFPILRHHKRFAIKSHAVHPNERLPMHKKLWKKFYSFVWDDDLTASIQSSLNPEEDTDYKVDSLRSVVEQLMVKHHSQEKILAEILQEMRKQNKQVSA